MAKAIAPQLLPLTEEPWGNHIPLPTLVYSSVKAGVVHSGQDLFLPDDGLDGLPSLVYKLILKVENKCHIGIIMSKLSSV
jgi:hypothetical protein